jgi:alginate O-acetyltransferase complex protein AlgI
MVFNSYVFLFGFLPIVCAVYFLLGKFPRIGTWWLVAASLFFYSYGRTTILWLLPASIAFNYVLSLALVRRPNKPLLTFGIVANVLLLCVFKYQSSLVASLAASMNLGGASSPMSWLLGLSFPLGISFYTFSQISYLVDTYRGTDRPSNLGDYALFVTFFPHLLSGPILRHSRMVPQFDSALRRRPISTNFATGALMIIMGLAKKVLIADPLAPLVAQAFDSTGSLDIGTAWLGTAAYSFQLYNDFSGYCDIALGVALLFNIRIPENFRAPYHSQSIQDFWRRWHISLSDWLRDYVFLALPGLRSRRTIVRYLNAVITMFVCGLWHGVGWTFVLWGLLHGVAVAVCGIWRKLGFRLHAAAGWALTFVFVNLSWVIFRSPDLTASRRVFAALFSGLPVRSLLEWWQRSGLALFRQPIQSWSSDSDPGRLALVIAVLLFLIPSYSFAIARKMKPNPLTAGFAAVLLTACVLRFTSATHFLYYFF